MLASKRKIFLSHAAQDQEFARHLADVIDRQVGEGHTFCSSRPADIGSSKRWQHEVFDGLDTAEDLIVLLTPNSQDRIWIGFEAGYFWNKHKGQNIHVLRHYDTQVPSPLSEIQAKNITSHEEMRDFFKELFQGSVEDDYDLQIEIEQLIETGGRIARKPAERTLAMFEHLLTTSDWILSPSNDKEIYFCEDDAQYRIEVTLHIDFENTIRTEPWAEKFRRSVPSQRHALYHVILSIYDIGIKLLTFATFDGGRYFIPYPEVDRDTAMNLDKDPIVYWDLNSIQMKVAFRIGKVYGMRSYYDIAEIAGIEIRE